MGINIIHNADCSQGGVRRTHAHHVDSYGVERCENGKAVATHPEMAYLRRCEYCGTNALNKTQQCPNCGHNPKLTWK